jgi:hypothetical protein
MYQGGQGSQRAIAPDKKKRKKKKKKKKKMMKKRVLGTHWYRRLDGPQDRSGR